MRDLSDEADSTVVAWAYPGCGVNSYSGRRANPPLLSLDGHRHWVLGCSLIDVTAP
ncbi:MAG: hypothetical protein QOE19_4056 [Actinomycetota bacterium]|jgi:hypothetical protein|nr:hypothetical protein [Actinomycetota bacterium]MDQ1664895.1 hypothetical protein [Actinomycetota bacterium]MDQ1668914.1 hypothetical protein [Actinomycetota bacterium]